MRIVDYVDKIEKNKSKHLSKISIIVYWGKLAEVIKDGKGSKHIKREIGNYLYFLFASHDEPELLTSFIEQHVMRLSSKFDRPIEEILFDKSLSELMKVLEIIHVIGSSVEEILDLNIRRRKNG